MEVRYRQSFLRDLKKLKKHQHYVKLRDFAFQVLPAAEALSEVPDVKALQGFRSSYRLRVGSFRIGIAVDDGVVELVRILDRRDFYRYFP